ncbi:hypothetical protein HLB42_09535 [Deinococcus sp. D7000]|nr:hypothetical protein HLB42_09535 [Deinococcus sp. D7000]
MREGDKMVYVLTENTPDTEKLIAAFSSLQLAQAAAAERRGGLPLVWTFVDIGSRPAGFLGYDAGQVWFTDMPDQQLIWALPVQGQMADIHPKPVPMPTGPTPIPHRIGLDIGSKSQAAVLPAACDNQRSGGGNKHDLDSYDKRLASIHDA